VTAGEFGTWTPIGAIQVSGGYDVAWKDTSSGQYIVWNVDSSGNYVSNVTSSAVSGGSLALETLETTFHQDLNGDGTIGPTTVVIQTDATTALTEIANTYSLYVGGSGPSLKYGGAAVTAGEFGTWTPIGAIQVSGGYDVAWKDTSSGQYVVWTTDSSGNYISNLTNTVSGTSATLESLETSFHQDLNGDGVIGFPAPAVIESSGSTSLVEAGTNYFLDNISSGTGPELKYGGAAVVAGQFGAWTPIGAEVTATGYEVAWKVAGADQYIVWNTDSSGSYVSNLTATVSGTNTTLESLETSFHQDLNGDGVIGIYATPGTALQIGGALAGTTGSATIGTGATLELAAADSASVTFSSSTGMLKLDHSATFSGLIFNFSGNGSLSGSDQIDLKDINFNLVHDTYAAGVLTVTDGTNTAELDFNGSYTLANFKFASDGTGGTIVYDPPVPTANPTTVITSTATDAILTGKGGDDNFVLNQHFGQAIITNFSPGTDTIQLDHTDFSTAAGALAAAHNDGHGNVVLADAAHDTLLLQNVTVAQLHEHSFIIS
jgi:serralysin